MIEREVGDGVAVVRLAHGKVNALDIDSLGALRDALVELEASDARAVVLTGTGAVFSAGADLRRVLRDGERYVLDNLPVLADTFATLFRFPRPVVAAVNGHAIAGGCVLVAACDYRVMARGAGTIGLAELKVGVPYPAAALEIVRFAVDPRHLQRLVYLGDGYSDDEALAYGLVDELVDPDALLARALAVAGRLASIPAESFRHVKMELRRPTLERIDRYAPELDPAAARIWFSEPVTEAIQSFMAALARG